MAGTGTLSWVGGAAVTVAATPLKRTALLPTVPLKLLPWMITSCPVKALEGSKLVMAGDPAQIDNPYVDSRSNGLVYTKNRLKGLPFVAHVSLSRGERSELADAGAQLM